MDIYQFFEAHSKVKLTEDQLSKLSFEEDKVVDNLNLFHIHAWLLYVYLLRIKIQLLIYIVPVDKSMFLI